MRRKQTEIKIYLSRGERGGRFLIRADGKMSVEEIEFFLGTFYVK